jgi:thioredoxin reductase (NADPH)
MSGENMANAFAERREQMFPRLTAEQIERLSRCGERTRVSRGTVLFNEGDTQRNFHVIISGEMEVVHPVDGREEPVTVHVPGEFTGETSMLTGRRTLVRGRMREDGELLVMTPDALRKVVQSDSELSELFLRAFILRRVALIANAIGDAVLIGSSHSAATLRIRDFLTRNGQPYTYLDVEKDPGVQALLDRFQLSVEDVPVIICRYERVLKNPTNEEVADCLQMNVAIEPGQVRDLVVVGAGPAGLAAAVYGASEGLDVLVVESHAPGGQAGASSKIENYLGFPTGISGQALAGRAFMQAEKFGADIVIARSGTRLRCERQPYLLDLADGTTVATRTVMIATGAQYRKIPLPDLARFEGVGVYYGATGMEAQLCENEDVIVVGGGNSAGQAAIFLARTARHVLVAVRGRGLAETMSRYLIQRIEATRNITLRAYTEVCGLEGDGRLERVHLQDSRSKERFPLPIRHLFLMTGAAPNTGWLTDCVALDEKGFVKTGPDLTEDDLGAWPLKRLPYLLETNRAGVFAVGDVRSNSIKRVASAVGEGSICVQFIHRTLAE